MPGYVAHYVHGDGIAAAIVLLRFREPASSRTAEFQLLARELAMQVLATKPIAVAPRDLDEAAWREELGRLRSSLHGLPSEEQMAKLKKARENYESNFCLLKQPFIKNDRLTVEDRVAEVQEALSERIEVVRFCIVDEKEAR
jgi:elongation factor Ts